ncbi:FecR protein [Anaerohalosphaera lusitana]|uniref:FecR protein n=1 Tax=Anaerohalosphaera lusitana TaxID=1936003 RepID=A0A1U9NK01_9BACT|nr:FecR domain-containing protein [Anaerohalosphaera lusitana]AQT67836.1 FecR protein [Anaerohalosphaera lusitana]
MSNDNSSTRLLALLIEESLNGTISAEGKTRLNELLRNDPDALDYYIDSLQLHSALQDPKKLFEIQQPDEIGPDFDANLWQALAQQEASAQTLEIDEPAAKPSTAKHSPHKTVSTHKPKKREVSKLAAYTLALSTAAALLLIIGLFITESRTADQVATVTDTINAQWSENSIKPGHRLNTHQKNLTLRSGFAKIRFDNNAEVILEGPAEIAIITGDQVRLNLGKLYSVVPPEACGFTVSTGNAKIMDLGTEFGVEVASSGSVQLHVLEGKTVLVAGQGKNKTSEEITADNARMVDPTTGNIYRTPCSDRLFVRNIDSDHNLLWRGEDINLADIVAHNFTESTRTDNWSIDTRTGDLRHGSFIKDTEKNWQRFNYSSDGKYHPVTSNPFVDGVFAPNPAAGPVQISSTGQTFENCPPTNDKFFVGIYRMGWYDSFELPENVRSKPANALKINPNQGITFDLDAFRRIYKISENKDFTKFYGVYGLNDHKAPQYPDTISSIHVLVDGRIRFEKQDYNIGDKGVLIDVPLYPDDRFLTIIATDGSDDDIRFNTASIADPTLILAK